MELEKEPKIKAKKRRPSKSARKPSMSSTSSNVHEPLRSGSEKEAVAVATVATSRSLAAAIAPAETTEERPPSLHYPVKSHQQSDQTHESGACGSTRSTSSAVKIVSSMRTTTAPIGRAPSADVYPQSSHLPPLSDISVSSGTKRRGNRAALVDREPSAQPGAIEAVQARAQTRAGMTKGIQEEIYLTNKQKTKLPPMQETKASSKSDTKQDEVKVKKEKKESAAPHSAPVRTDRPHLSRASAGTSNTATQHTPAAAMAPPVVRHTVTVDTGTDTPFDLWAAGGPVPELRFAKAEYTSPAGADAAMTAGESAKQQADKQRIQSMAKEKAAVCPVIPSVGGKSGPASTEVGGVLSTEATVLLDVNPWVRFPLLVMNHIIWLIGLTLLLVGVYAYVDTWTQMDIPTHKPSMNTLSLFVIKVEISVMLFGMVSMSVSFCGCVGALRENACLLNVYSSFITALLLINLIGGFIVFLLPAQIKNVFSQALSMELIVHYRDSADFQKLMDNIQEAMQCRGISRSSFRDWNDNMYFNCSRTNPSNERCSVPYSCCKRNSTDQVVSLSCGRNVLNITDYDAWFQVYTGNCLDSVHRYVRGNAIVITAICLTFVILLAFVQMVTQTLIDEVLIIRRIYQKFYDRAYELRRGQEQTEQSEKLASGQSPHRASIERN